MKLCFITQNIYLCIVFFMVLEFKVNNEDCGCRETTFSFLCTSLVTALIYLIFKRILDCPSERKYAKACEINNL